MKNELGVALTIAGEIGRLPILEGMEAPEYNSVLLTEGISRSYDAESIYEVLSKRYRIGSQGDIDIPEIDFCAGFDAYRKNDYDTPTGEVIVIVFFIPDGFIDKQVVLDFMKRSGWTLAEKEGMVGRNDVMVYKYEKDRQSDRITNVPEYLFHLTPSNKVGKIMRNGLTPHAGNKKSDHIERIYLLPPFSYDISYTMVANALRNAQAEKNQFNGKKASERVPYTLLRVDTSKCRPGLKLYGDPNMNGAFWTFDNIPPEAIEVAKENL